MAAFAAQTLWQPMGAEADAAWCNGLHDMREISSFDRLIPLLADLTDTSSGSAERFILLEFSLYDCMNLIGAGYHVERGSEQALTHKARSTTASISRAGCAIGHDWGSS